MENIEVYSHLWTTEKDQWVLIRTSPDSMNTCIYNKRRKVALLIENENILKSIIDKMIKSGASVLEAMPKD